MKSDGYTFIETILAIGILSILLWNLVPQLHQLEKKGSLQYQRILEKTSTTKLVHVLVSDTSNIHWKYWQKSPSIYQEENRTEILWVDADNLEHSYEITREDSSILIMKDSLSTKFSLPSLENFTIEAGGGKDSDILINISTSHQSIILPLRFGSKAVCLYE